MVAESLPLRGDDGAGLDQRQGGVPAGPQACQPGPEHAIGWTQPRAWHTLLVDGQLVP
jgi:hypothetical protein